jgi:hypothetical protein
MVLTRCPVCAHELSIRRLECGGCGTALEGDFQLGWLRALSAEQLGFLKVFVEARGKIKDVEAALGLSYPTVVARLEELVRAVGEGAPPPAATPHPHPHPHPAAPESAAQRMEILEDLAQGRIDPAEAARRLRKR